MSEIIEEEEAAAEEAEMQETEEVETAETKEVETKTEETPPEEVEEPEPETPEPAEAPQDGRKASVQIPLNDLLNFPGELARSYVDAGVEALRRGVPMKGVHSLIDGMNSAVSSSVSIFHMDKTLEKTEVEMPARRASASTRRRTPRSAMRSSPNGHVRSARQAGDERSRRSLRRTVPLLHGEGRRIFCQHGKAAVESVATEIERKYNLEGDEARAIAEGSFRSEEQKQMNLREDMEWPRRCSVACTSPARASRTPIRKRLMKKPNTTSGSTAARLALCLSVRTPPVVIWPRPFSRTCCTRHCSHVARA